jgi:tRNA threonylcarbamoyladenosine biosynthesis protein TsaB
MAVRDPSSDTLLAFDTSTESMALAAQVGPQRRLANLPGGAAASATLLPALEALLADAGGRMADVAAVAFGCGPGAFTGLRTSCAVAQGLGYGLQRPVLPIDSLLIVAEQARRVLDAEADIDIAVVMDARMAQLYAARYRYRCHDRSWQVDQAPALWDPQALAEAWDGASPVASAGSGLALTGEWLQAACPPALRVRVGEDRAGALIELALRAWQAGAGVDAAAALPVYLRDKVAQTTAERAAARAGGQATVQASPVTPAPPGGVLGA